MDTFDLSIYQGQTYALSLTLRDSNSTPINLNGFAISGFIKTRFGDTSKLCDLNVAIANAPSGIVTLSIPASGTAALPVNYAFYDVEMLNSGDGSVTKVLAGKVSVFPEVTY